MNRANLLVRYSRAKRERSCAACRDGFRTIAFQPRRHDKTPLASTGSKRPVSCCNLALPCPSCRRLKPCGRSSFWPCLIPVTSRACDLTCSSRVQTLGDGSCIRASSGGPRVQTCPVLCCCCCNCCLVAFLPTTSAGVRQPDNTYNRLKVQTQKDANGGWREMEKVLPLGDNPKLKWAEEAPPFYCSPCFRNSRNLLMTETQSREEGKGEEKNTAQKQRLNKT
ncbi:hypothetical protein V8C26DRAFT_25311 [Trichoderma gracile]